MDSRPLKLSSLTWAAWIGRSVGFVELTMTNETSEPVEIFMRPSDARILARAINEAADSEPMIDPVGDA